jgi:hypothetical protein
MKNSDSTDSFIIDYTKESGIELGRNRFHSKHIGETEFERMEITDLTHTRTESRIQNQKLYILFFISVIGLLACQKSTLQTGGNAGWRLANKYLSIGNSSSELIPSKDSVVLLELDSNGLYSSRLNNKIVSQGSYSIAAGTSVYSYGDSILQLNNFQTTGIFNLFKLVEVGTSGQVISSFDGFYMTISHDSLTLSSAFTPGGYLYYLFVKN